ncbi:MAG: hypothetical protein QOF46_2649 [Paraburkholderia sp.]|nr:hypothetical protein [Paraburkholderia sp.]
MNGAKWLSFRCMGFQMPQCRPAEKSSARAARIDRSFAAWGHARLGSGCGPISTARGFELFTTRPASRSKAWKAGYRCPQWRRPRETALTGIHHVHRVEAQIQAVYPAFLAADQCMHDLHAGKLGQCDEPCPLDDCISYGSAHRAPRGLADLHTCGETLLASIRQCADRRLPDGNRRCLRARESLRHSLRRAHFDGRYFSAFDAGRLISLRRPCATPSGGLGISLYHKTKLKTFRTSGLSSIIFEPERSCAIRRPD